MSEKFVNRLHAGLWITLLGGGAIALGVIGLGVAYQSAIDSVQSYTDWLNSQDEHWRYFWITQHFVLPALIISAVLLIATWPRGQRGSSASSDGGYTPSDTGDDHGAPL